MTLKSDTNFEENRTFFLKNDMRNLVNFNASSGNSENLHFNGQLLLKVWNVWAKKNIELRNDLWFQKWHKEFGEQVVESKVDKSSAYNVLTEGMYFLNKSSPSNFNFSDFPLLVWSCPNSSCDFWNQNQFLYKFCTIL